MKEKVLFIVALAFTIALYAQPMGMGGGGSRPQMGGEGMRGAEGFKPVDPVEAAGLFLFETKDVEQNCKIKSDETKLAVARLIAEYTQHYDKITVELAPQIDSLQRIKPQGRPQQGGGVRGMMQSMHKIREQSREMHKILNEGMTKVLDEKELKRWSSYYKALCSEKRFRVNVDPRERGAGRPAPPME